MKATSIAHRITALAMAFLMFFSSVEFTVDLHYCQGKLKTFNFFGKAKSCHELGEGMKDCPFHGQMGAANESEGSTINKKSCCSNKTFHFQADLDQQTQVENAVVAMPTHLQYFVIAFVEILINSSVVEIESPSFTLYKSPLIPRDIYALLETYLL
jgi:hypothetical protein